MFFIGNDDSRGSSPWSLNKTLRETTKKKEVVARRKKRVMGDMQMLDPGEFRFRRWFLRGRGYVYDGFSFVLGFVGRWVNGVRE